jgi:hypothetical protein
MQLEIEKNITQQKEKVFAEINNFFALNLEQKKSLEDYVSKLLDENGKYNFIKNLLPKELKISTNKLLEEKALL